MAYVRMLGTDAVALTRSELDLTDIKAIPGVLDRVDPEVVVNCAAYTKVDQAEEEEELATRINGQAVGAMADWCSEKSRPLLTFSTDYVFRGDSSTPYVESSPTDPINAYGRSKLVGERLALDAGALVVRASWVISGTHPNFVSTMIHLAGERPLKVVDDQVGRPTVVSDLAAASWTALTRKTTGLVHMANEGETTWYRLAVTAIQMAGIEDYQISPCTTEEYPTAAKRPQYSVLGSERHDEVGIDPLPHWRDSLPGVVDEILSWV